MSLVAILRGLTPEQAPSFGRILFDAGFRMLEVPLNRPGAIEAMRALIEIAPPDAVIGGGTMLSKADVDRVREAGGRLMVSPDCKPEVIAHAVACGMIALPGVATPSEAFRALDAGAQGLKLFPAEMMPPGVVKSMASVLPSGTQIYPVGSITPDNMAAYAKAGATGFGIGGALYKPGIDEAGLRRAADAFMTAREAILQAGR
jgi:2-dehydro-3-deoxyphosphogalactonate aldolase